MRSPLLAPAARLTACLALVVVPLAAAAEDGGNDVGAFRAKMEKWVETRQLISEERADWAAEQETLEATRELLQQQKESLEAEVAKLEETSDAADDERRDLLLRRGEYKRANGVLAEQIRAMEEDVLALAPRLPGPLETKLDPLLVQIPEDPEQVEVSLGQRLLNVLGVLSQADKFNGTATLAGETRPIGDQKVQVRTLYWGLGQAFYVDARGSTAGVGRPGDDGWVFTNEPALAGDAARLLDIYEGNVDLIRFVEMPVEVR